MKIAKIALVSIFALLFGGYLLSIYGNPIQQSKAELLNGGGIFTTNGTLNDQAFDQKSSNSYYVTFNLAPQNSSVFGKHYYVVQYFCPSTVNGDPQGPQLDGPGHYACLRNRHISDTGTLSHFGTIATGGSPATPALANPAFHDCGTYQIDLAVDGFMGYNGGDSGFLNAGWYNTGVNCSVPNPTPTNTPIPTATPTQVPTVTPTTVPTPNASCVFNPTTVGVDQGTTANINLSYSTDNLPANNKKVTVCLSKDSGNQSYLSSTSIDYGNYPVSVAVTGGHTYTANLYLKNISTDSMSCTGTIIASCQATTTVNPTPTGTITPTPTDTPTPTPTTTNIITAKCGDKTITIQQGTTNIDLSQCMITNISPVFNYNPVNDNQYNPTNTYNPTVNVTTNTNTTTPQVTVLPANTTSLPSTGTPEVLYSIFGLIPLGFKLKKLV